MLLGIPDTFSELPLIGVMLRDATAFKIPPAHSVAREDIYIEKQHTLLDPSRTRFFQEANIPTRILRGCIEVFKRTLLVKKGETITPSFHELFRLMRAKPYKCYPEPKCMFVVECLNKSNSFPLVFSMENC